MEMSQKKEKYLANGDDKSTEATGQTFDNPAYVDMTGAKNVQINNPTYTENHYVAIETSKGVSPKYKVVIVIVLILLLAAAIAGVVVYFLVVAKAPTALTDKSTGEETSHGMILEKGKISPTKLPGKDDSKDIPTISSDFANVSLEILEIHENVTIPGPVDLKATDLTTHAPKTAKSEDTSITAPSLPFTDRHGNVALEPTAKELVSKVDAASPSSPIYPTIEQRRETAISSDSGISESATNVARTSANEVQRQSTRHQGSTTAGPIDSISPGQTSGKPSAEVGPAASNFISTSDEEVPQMLLTSLVPDVGTAFKSEVPMVTTPSDLATKNASPAVSAKSPESQITTEMMKTETSTSQQAVGKLTTGISASTSAICGQTHVISPGDSVEIRSPNYPSNYDNNLDCTWYISTQSGNRIYLTFVMFDLEIEYDTLTLSDVNNPMLVTYSGTQSPTNYISRGTSLYIRFHSDESITYSGFRLTAEDYKGPDPVPDTRGCNMSHILSVGEEWDVVTPYYPSNYGNDLRCQWTVESLTGRVDVYFIDMRIEENYDAITMVAVDAGGDFVPVINNYSGNQSPGNFSVNHGKVMLFFLSDGASTERGFWVRFKAETNDAEIIDDTPTPLTTDDCNRQISIQRGQVVQFESPNYPDLYSSGLICLWAVHTTDESHIVVRFSSFETESNYDFVDIGIGNGEEVEQSRLIRHSGSAIPGDLLIPSSNAWIRFYSDGYQELGGFQGDIEAIPPVANTTRPSLTTVQEECGGDIFLAIGQSVNITSPNFPGNYDDLLRCMWVFTTQDDCKLHISFKSFDTEALYDYVEIGEGSGPISGTIEIRHHGNNLPIDYISVTSQSWVSFTSDISMNLGGFQYTVTAIESIEDSSQSSLIVDTTSQRQEQTSSCVQRFNLSAGDTMTLKTPNFPNQYDNALNCLWTFFVPDDVMISVVFDSFQTEAVYDYMEAGLGPGPGAGTTLTTQHSGNALPRPLSGSPSVWISFLSDGSIQSSGFEATISAFKVTTSQVSPAAVYPSTTPTSVHCTRNYNLTSGDVVYLTSPNFPNNYGNDLDCLWKFVATDGAQLQVHFISFSTQYGHDFLEAGEGFGRISGTPILERKSGPWLPLDFTTQGNTAWIDFHSDDSDSNEGFEITVTAVKQDITTTPAPPQVTTSAPTTAALGCRRTFHLQEDDTVTVTTPNYPSPYDDLLDCLWVFIASDQSVLEVSFQTFSSELGYDYMEAGEGSGPTDGTTIIRRHSGAQLPDDFSAMSSSAWISFYSDVSMNDSGFEVKVTALQPQPDVTTRSTKRTTSGEPECLTVLSIPAENTVIVESPNYPSRYDNNLECTWIISTVEGYQLNVIFNTFDTEQEYDVLETGEGIEPDKRRFDQFSGSTLPDGFTTLSSSMWIVFRSDRSVNKSGFHLTVTSVQY